MAVGVTWVDERTYQPCHGHQYTPEMRLNMHAIGFGMQH